MTIACPGRIPDAFAALYHASFVERKPIHNAELFMPILEKFLGKEVAEEVLAKVLYIGPRTVSCSST